MQDLLVAFVLVTSNTGELMQTIGLGSGEKMRSRIRRHIGALLKPSVDLEAKQLGAGLTAAQSIVPREFTPHQYVLFLLHVAALLEHALMVEYLYAGFSLGGPHVPEERRAEVARWQETILGIAKEEMGHLMTVQNLLRCLGGALNFDREDYPWDSEFYPFPFQLEPLSRQSLAKYVYAESPPPDPKSGKEIWTGSEADEVRALAEKAAGKGSLHRVGALYARIESLIADPCLLQDRDFRGATFPFQANWDEWGRGYQGGARGNALGGSMPGTPDVLIRPVTARSDALAAIRAVATQGEATPTSSAEAPSHFARFLEIFRRFPKDESWSPSRNVPLNPIVVSGRAESKDDTSWEGTPITHPRSKAWAHLFNIRYQLLLTCLMRSFEYPSNLSEASQATPRGLLLHATFGEMYNLRALAYILVRAPLAEHDGQCMAGPPFQMPYTLKLPVDTVDRWQLHLDLLDTSRGLVETLLQDQECEQRTYLRALEETDVGTAAMIEKIMGGPPFATPALPQRYR
jgi:hypothetical protein